MNILLGINCLRSPEYSYDQENKARPYFADLLQVFYQRGKKLFRLSFITRYSLGPDKYSKSSRLDQSTEEILECPSQFTYTPKEKTLLFVERSTYSSAGECLVKFNDAKKKYVILVFDPRLGYEDEDWKGGAKLRIKQILDRFTYVKPSEEMGIYFDLQQPPSNKGAGYWKVVKDGNFLSAVNANRDPNFKIKFENLVGPYDNKIIALLREGGSYTEDRFCPLTAEHKLALWWRSTPGTAAEDYAKAQLPLSLLQEIWTATVSEGEGIGALLHQLSPEVFGHFFAEMEFLTKDTLEGFLVEEDYYTQHSLIGPLEPVWGFFRTALVRAMAQNANRYSFLLEAS